MEYISNALSTFKKDDEKLKKSIIGGLFLMFSIFLIPAFFIQGYMVKILRATETRGQDAYPEWTDWSDIVVNGFIAYLFTIAVMIPAYIFIYAPQIAGMTDTAAGLAILGIGYLLTFIVGYFVPILLTLVFRDGFGSITDLSRIKDISFSSEYLITYLSVAVIGVVFGIAMVMFILFTIGLGLLVLPFVFFAFQAIIMFAYGEAITAADPKNTQKKTKDHTDTPDPISE